MTTLLVIWIGGVICLLYLAYRIGRSQTNKLLNGRDANKTVQHLEEKINLLTKELRTSLEDPVTGLPGWKIFEDRLTQQLKESARHHFTLGVVYVDINNFKVINHAVSVEAGNQLLKAVAQRLMECIRQVDSMGRLEKDIFVLSLAQLAKPETAAVVAQRILQSLGQPFQVDNHELTITVNMGIAIYPSDGTDATSLMNSASYALGLAKRKGKHNYQFYQQKMFADSRRELALYSGLGRETIFKELRLFYQPVMNVRDESVSCMDALLHWDCPDLGLIGPEELFSLMEKQNKATMLTEWLLENACKQFLHWRSVGFNPGLISVPVTLNQVTNSRFVYRLSQLLQNLHFNAEWLMLEIKDGEEQVSFDVVEKAFNMLSYVGVQLAIDHFGIGSSGLKFLKNFPIRYVKLDPSLIADIEFNQRTFSVVEAIIFIARNLSLQVIASGVETSQQLAVLRELGCALIQGPAVGAKLSEQEVAATMISPAGQ